MLFKKIEHFLAKIIDEVPYKIHYLKMTDQIDTMSTPDLMDLLEKITHELKIRIIDNESYIAPNSYIYTLEVYSPKTIKCEHHGINHFTLKDIFIKYGQCTIHSYDDDAHVYYIRYDNDSEFKSVIKILDEIKDEYNQTQN